MAQLNSFPSVPVFDIFQLPAKSITVSRALLASPLAKSLETKEIIKSMCEREETAFIWVQPTDLFYRPKAKSWYPSQGLDIYLSVTCSIKTPLFLFSLSFKLRRVKSSRSVTFQLYISTKVTFARRSMFDGRILTFYITLSIIRGKRPLFNPFNQGPTHVQVFPEAVCPQQKIVPLMPSKAALTIQSATVAKTVSCSTSSQNTLSNAKLRNGEGPVPSKLVTLIERQSTWFMHRLAPYTWASNQLKGRTLTKTFILLPPRQFILLPQYDFIVFNDQSYKLSIRVDEQIITTTIKKVIFVGSNIFVNNKMSRLVRGKYIDKGSSSRISLGKSSVLPMITSKRLDSFTFSLRRHINNSSLQNPQNMSARKSEPIQYDFERQIRQQYTQPQQKSYDKPQIYRYQSMKQKQQKCEELNWRSQSLKMREKPMSQIYQAQISKNINNYGVGMLRSSHRNSLGLEGSEQKLVQLHYRLKKQRQQQIIARQQRAAAARFKALMSRFESI